VEHRIVVDHEELSYPDIRTLDGVEGDPIVYAHPRTYYHWGALVGPDGRPTPDGGVISEAYVSDDAHELIELGVLADLRLDLLAASWQ
jgi:hypothetical protein